MKSLMAILIVSLFVVNASMVYASTDSNLNKVIVESSCNMLTNATPKCPSLKQSKDNVVFSTYVAKGILVDPKVRVAKGISIDPT
ncbi:MAG: hypothetical protein OQK51_04545, partial [Kangiellaceae bacterium]|nr:hypothetical protein [Kangiellaceae bacterium]